MTHTEFPDDLHRFRYRKNRERLSQTAKRLAQCDLHALMSRKSDLLAMLQVTFRRIAPLVPGANVLGALADCPMSLMFLITSACRSANQNASVSTQAIAEMCAALDDLNAQIAALQASLGLLPTP